VQKYDEGVFEHVAVAQILKETRSGCIHLASALSHLLRQRPMAIPTGMVELNEADAFLSKTACDETVPRKAAGCLYIWAVKSADGGGSVSMDVASGTLVCMRKASSN
jgi:hypothetical protein